VGLEEVAAELYSLAPEEFTAARNARAKQAKDEGDDGLAAQLRRLRKPTVGAWLVNQLVRRNRAQVEQLFDLGAKLRAAQGTLGADALRALGEQRRRLTRAVAEQAADIGREEGRKVSAQVVTAVEETLRSAMVDPQAGSALATGLIVDTFSSTGLDPVDIAAVVAVPGAVAEDSGSGAGATSATAAPARKAPEKRRDEKAIAKTRQELEEAEQVLAQAEGEAESARQAAVEAARRTADLGAELTEARRRVKDLHKRLEAAEKAQDEARRSQVAATKAERSAVEAAQRLRRRLQALLDVD